MREDPTHRRARLFVGDRIAWRVCQCTDLRGSFREPQHDNLGLYTTLGEGVRGNAPRRVWRAASCYIENGGMRGREATNALHSAMGRKTGHRIYPNFDSERCRVRVSVQVTPKTAGIVTDGYNRLECQDNVDSEPPSQFWVLLFECFSEVAVEAE